MNDNSEKVADCLHSPATRKVLDELKEEMGKKKANNTDNKKGRSKKPRP